jgi:hypothetical protein
MISFVRNSEIDLVKWDECISNSGVTNPFSYSWYLNIMSPGWNAIIEGNYTSVFPLPCRYRFGINYIATPVFLQKLGVINSSGNSIISSAEFLKILPEEYSYIDLCIWDEVHIPGFTTTKKDNYVIDLANPYSELYGKFNRNCKRNIESSDLSGITVTDKIAPEELIDLFRSGIGQRVKGVKQIDYMNLSKLINHSLKNGKGRIIGASLNDNKLIFGLFYIADGNNRTMILLANTEESLKKKIGFFIYNELIKESAGSGGMFDFMGSSIEPIAVFMKSFGAELVPYYRVCSNKLPFPFKYLK